jgi:hypothetical protein
VSFFGKSRSPGNSGARKKGITPTFGDALGGPAAQPMTSEHLAFLQVQNPDVSEMMFRALRMNGQLPKLLDPRYNASLQIEDYTRFEYWWLRRGTRYFASATATAGANTAWGFFSAAATTPRKLCIIDSIILFGAATVTLEIGNSGVPGAGAIANSLIVDDRQGPASGLGNSGFQLQTGSSAAPVHQPSSSTVKTTSPFGSFGPFVLSANGVALSFIAAVAALDLTVAVSWRERELLPSES